MKFKRCENHWNDMMAIQIVPLMNIFFLICLFFALTNLLTYPTTIAVIFPKALTSDVIQNDNVIVAITSENVIYLDGKIISTKDLKAQLGRGTGKSIPVLIKADRRASVGRIVEVWDLCRALCVERVNIATNRD